MPGMLGPRMSASMSPIQPPICWSANARFTLTGDLQIGGGRGRMPDRKPQHARDARAEDVRIHEPDPAPDLLEREREIHADRGLADRGWSWADARPEAPACQGCSGRGCPHP